MRLTCVVTDVLVTSCTALRQAGGTFLATLAFEDAPRHGTRILKRVTGAAGSIAVAAARVTGKALSPHKASVKRLAEMPLSVIGTGCIDFAGFHVAHGWGWLLLGASLFVLEHMIADDDDKAA